MFQYSLPSHLARTAVLLLALVLYLSVSTVRAEEPPRSWRDMVKDADSAAGAMKRLDAFRLYESSFGKCRENEPRREIARKLANLKVLDPPSLSDKETELAAVLIRDRVVSILMNSLGGFTVPAQIQIIGKIVETDANRARWAEEKTRELTATFMEALTEDEKAELDKIVASVPPSQLDGMARKYANEKNYRMAIKLYWASLLARPNLTPEEREKVLAKIHESMQKLVTEVTREEQKKVDELFESTKVTDWETGATVKFLIVGQKEKVADVIRGSAAYIDSLAVLFSDLYSSTPLPETRIPILLYPYPLSSVVQIGPALWVSTNDVTKAGLPEEDFTRAFSLYMFRDYLYLQWYASGVACTGELYARYMTGEHRKTVGDMKTLVKDYRKFHEGRTYASYEMPGGQIAAGMFCMAILALGMEGPTSVDWLKFRDFLDVVRNYRGVGLPRYMLVHLVGFALASAYGREVYEHLTGSRFGVNGDTHTDMGMQLGAMLQMYREACASYDNKEYDAAAEVLWDLVRDFPDNALKDMAYRKLIACYTSGGKHEVATKLKARIGAIPEWMIVGPFYPVTGAQLAEVLPPELTINYGSSFTNAWQKAVWKKVATNAQGWFSESYSYPSNTVMYALTFVKVAEETKASLFFSSSERYKLWVNEDLTAFRDDRMGRFEHDSDRYPVTLRPGVNKFLVKVYNASGTIECGARLISETGLPIPGLEYSIANLDAEVPKQPRPEPDKEIYAEKNNADGGWYNRWLVTAGRFVSKQNIIYPQSTDPAGCWHRFFRPPSSDWARPRNIAWLRPACLPQCSRLSAKVTLGLSSSRHSKFLALFRGEGEDDPQGGLSVGISTHGYSGEQLFAAWWYDKLLYALPLTAAPATTAHTYEAESDGNRLWLKVNGREIFKGVSMFPVNGKSSFGVCTWEGAGFTLTSVEMRGVK